MCMYERGAETTGTSYLLAYGRRCGLKQSSSSFSALLPSATLWCLEQLRVSRIPGVEECRSWSLLKELFLSVGV